MRKIICLFRDKSEIIDLEPVPGLVKDFILEWQTVNGFTGDGHLYVCPFFFVHEFRRILPQALFFAWGFEGMTSQLFEAGAADFLRAPWSVEELFARSRNYFGKGGRKFSWGYLYFDGNRTEYEGIPLELSSREHRLIALLANNAGHALSHLQIERYLGMRVPLGSRAVNMAITRIRQQLEFASLGQGSTIIRCLYSVGYLLME